MAEDGSKSVQPEPALDEMTRALWWASDGASHAHGAEGLRDALHEFAAQMRIDSRVIFPMGETTLQSPTAWRTRLKHRIFRVTRPVSWRYDRLLAEHAELTAALANQLMAAEAEIARLRAGAGDPNQGDPSA
jgi:hypothetical protein